MFPAGIDKFRSVFVKEKVFVIGGCRSGKSSYAVKLAEGFAGDRKIYIATATPGDDEMRQRIKQHQKERSKNWTTIEEPVLLSEAINENSQKAGVILVDCLTLWVSNLFLQQNDEVKISGDIKRLTQSIESAPCPLIFVSNEVGSGIVPENRLSRLFRDSIGFANQNVAACCNSVIIMVAGIAVKIK
ncbi:MAG: adenosylcobinamide kinase / adenosylcobinamide-phosphate guanylyltransferase [Desulfobacteraceae bacterium Eth-SRB1]|nr:MAG: adenosylcobinamide kinase / adenosylcobinamide-phosphate guanylyltransferase [Desulfobacteraceae bacterium Eth-SRB1]